jgi:LPXTG-motif cell wall-anchored protein
MANTGANSGPMSIAGFAMILAGAAALFVVVRNRFVDAEQ